MTLEEPRLRHCSPTRFIPPDVAVPLVLLAVFAITAALPDATPALQFKRDAIATGQWYRLISAHFVHANTAHALMNTAATIGLFVVFRGVVGPMQWLLSIGICALAISTALLAFTDIDWYVGFSGILHGLLAMALIGDYRLAAWLRTLLMTGLVAKVLNELFGAGSASASWLDVAVISEAHAAGTLTGALIALVMLWQRRRA
jgi:rhomboid family GlyGly-CTERM serine protease